MADIDEDNKLKLLYNFVSNLEKDPAVTPFNPNENDRNLFFDGDSDDDLIFRATISSDEFNKLEELSGNGGWWIHPLKLGRPYDPKFSDDLFPTKEQNKRISDWLHEPFFTEPIFSEKISIIDRINVMNELENDSNNLPYTPKTPKSALLAPKQVFSDGAPIKSNMIKQGPGTYDIQNESNIASDKSHSIDKSFTLNRPIQMNLYRRDTFQLSGNNQLNPRSNNMQSESLSNSVVRDTISEDEEGELNNLPTPRHVAKPTPTPKTIKTPFTTPKPSRNPQPSKNNLEVTNNVTRTFSNENLKLSCSHELANSTETFMRSSNDDFREIARQQEAMLKSSVGSKFRSPSDSKNNSKENLASSNPDFHQMMESIGQSRHKTNVSYDRLPSSSESILSKAREENENLLLSNATYRRSTSRETNFINRSKEYFEKNSLNSSQINDRKIRSESCETRNSNDSTEKDSKNFFFGSSYNENLMDSLHRRLKESSYSSLEPALKQQEDLQNSLRKYRMSKAGRTSNAFQDSSLESMKDSRDASREDQNLRRSYDIIPKLPPVDLPSSEDANNNNKNVNASYDLLNPSVYLRKPSSQELVQPSSVVSKIEMPSGEQVSKKPPLPGTNSNTSGKTLNKFSSGTTKLQRPTLYPPKPKKI